MINESEEIGLLDLVAVLLKRKKLIIYFTISGMVFALAFSILSLLLPKEKSFLPNVYSPQALMLINDSSSSGGTLSSLLSSSGLGSLAGMAGVNVSGGTTYSALAVYLSTTNEFLDTIVDQFHLIDKWKIKKNPRTTSRNMLKKSLKTEFDKESGVLIISFIDIDPIFAQSIVNFAVLNMEKRFTDMGLDKNKLTKVNLEVNLKNCYNEIVRLQQESQRIMGSANSGNSLPSGSSVMLEATRLEIELKAQEAVYTQLKTQYELVKVQLASETPVFQILEYAEVPDQKSGPSRGMLCIIVTFASFLLSVLLAFFLHVIENIRKDPEAMAKLKTVAK